MFRRGTAPNHRQHGEEGNRNKSGYKANNSYDHTEDARSSYISLVRQSAVMHSCVDEHLF